MTDVTIPVDVAKSFATGLRNDWPINKTMLADLLDPQPATLREQVARVMCAEVESDDLRTWDQSADAVLAVVADWLAAQPLAESCGSPNGEGCFVREQRDHDVRLLRGAS